MSERGASFVEYLLGAAVVMLIALLGLSYLAQKTTEQETATSSVDVLETADWVFDAGNKSGNVIFNRGGGNASFSSSRSFDEPDNFLFVDETGYVELNDLTIGDSLTLTFDMFLTDWGATESINLLSSDELSLSIRSGFVELQSQGETAQLTPQPLFTNNKRRTVTIIADSNEVKLIIAGETVSTVDSINLPNKMQNVRLGANISRGVARIYQAIGVSGVPLYNLEDNTQVTGEGKYGPIYIDRPVVLFDGIDDIMNLPSLPEEDDVTLLMSVYVTEGQNGILWSHKDEANGGFSINLSTGEPSMSYGRNLNIVVPAGEWVTVGFTVKDGELSGVGPGGEVKGAAPTFLGNHIFSGDKTTNLKVGYANMAVWFEPVDVDAAVRSMNK